jgi:hypothetical protein
MASGTMEPQVASIHDEAMAVNELACKLNRQTDSVRDWLNNEDGNCKDAACVAPAMRPLPQLSSARSELASAVNRFAEIARHIGAPVCE